MSTANLEECLPAELRQPAPTIIRIAAGLSGAGVYRVEAEGRALVLKVSDSTEPLAPWQRKVQILQLAANAGLAPNVIHVDEERRAVLSVLVVDRSFPAFYRDPRTHELALLRLGQILRRVHDLPLLSDADSKDPRAFLAETWSALAMGSPVPAFVADAVQRVLAEEAPSAERPMVLSHNDVNPSNLVYDGEKIMLLDWDVAGRNDPYYDLAASAVFLRMDDETCRRLLTAYDGEASGDLPLRFTYDRRLVAALAGANILRLARERGHTASASEESLESTPTLGDFYQRVRSGSLSFATGEAQWLFGLALLKASISL